MIPQIYDCLNSCNLFAEKKCPQQQLREGRRMPRLLVGDECDGIRFKCLAKRPSRDAPTFGRRDSLEKVFLFPQISAVEDIEKICGSQCCTSEILSSNHAENVLECLRQIDH
jgi:hypothetical protein